MEEAPMRKIAEAHGQAVVDGDFDAVAADLVPEMRPALPEVAKLLPQPVTGADVIRLDIEDDHAIVEIRYSNDEKSLTLRSRWEDVDGRPLIVEAAPAD
jgi:hypothetical protein